MIEALNAAAGVLADVLAAENEALTAVDYDAAVLLADDKRQAADAFAAVWARAQAMTDPAAGDLREMALPMVGRLRELAEANNRNLERAIAVQGRVIGCILRAVPQAEAEAPCYGSTGVMARGTRATPLTVLSNA